MSPSASPTDQYLELRASEERLRLALQTGGMGVADCNLLTGKVIFSESLERIFGLEPGSFGGTVEAFSRLIHPEDRESFFDSVRQNSHPNQERDFEFRTMAPDGAVRWIAGRAGAVRDKSGKAVRWVGVAFDITHRKQTEARLAAQYAITRVLSESETLVQAAGVIIQTVCESFHWDTGAIWTVDHDSDTLRCIDTWQRPGGALSGFAEATRSSRFPQGVGLPGRVWQSGEPAWIPDFAKDLNTGRALIAKEHNLHSYFAFPLRVGAEVVGVMEVLSREIRQLDSELLPISACIGSQMGQVIKRKRTEDLLARLNRQLAERVGEFQKLVEVAPIGVCISEDARCEVIWMNPAGAKLAGLPAGANVSMSGPRADTLPYKILRNGRELRPEELDLQVAAATGRELHDMESDIVRNDGTVINTLCYAAPLFHEDGSTRGALGVFVDITNRKLMEEALRESESRLRTVFDQAAMGIAEADSIGHLVLVNQKYCDILGYSRQELLGKTFLELTHPEDRAENEALVAKLISGEAAGYTMEKRYVRKDGSPVWVHVVTSRVQNGGSEQNYSLAVVEDITERKRLHEQILVSQKLESLGVLAGGVAHDFNNLLTGIMGNASLALERAPSAPIRSMLEDVVAASEQASHLTRQMLAYAGKGRFWLEPVDLSELLRDVQMLIKAAIPKHVPVRLNLARRLPMVKGDASQMQQLVMNLVINAAEAIGESTSGAVLVSTRLKQIDRKYIEENLDGSGIEPGLYVKLRVQDNGCGMDEAIRSKIFDPFFTTKFTGRGLGLAAVSGIVRGHQGAIHVSTSLGQGTTFTVFLPVSNESPEPPDESPLDAELNGAGTILVVDDEEVVRESAKKALEHYGYDVLLAENGQQAVDMFPRIADEVSLVLLDLTMPAMSGDKVAGLLRLIRPSTPVIISSGYDETAVLSYFPDQTVHFLHKPYTPYQLAEKIKSVLDQL